MNPTQPPAIPTVDRVTGKVSTTRVEDQGQLDGWEFSDEPDSTFLMGPDYCRPNNASRKKGSHTDVVA